MSQNTGKVSKVIGAVVDVEFSSKDSTLPKIYDSLEITRDDDKIVGTKKSTAFEMDTEKETIYFWKSSYTWEELFQIMEYIKEHRELNAQPEEAPF